jgi:hypothetical protein
LSRREFDRRREVAVILSGGNIDAQSLGRVVSGDL